MHTQIMKWLIGGIISIVACYVVFSAVVLRAMLEPPERFGLFMRHIPEVLVWRGLPASRMWLWARRGMLRQGDQAPDFRLPRHDHSGEVQLSSYRGQRPVVLVFGSYT